ncbi:MAG TPA: ABC transporter C-terminal domain-containing protein, partial [Candidatus Elarobacter sp.]
APAPVLPPARDRRSAHHVKQELYRLRRAVNEAEARVARLDERRRDLELEFAAPDLYGDSERVVALQHALEANRGEADEALAAWERAVLALESHTAS